MEEIINFILQNQFTAAVAAFLGILFLYFTFKKLIKFALLMAILLIAMVGYMYFKDHQTAPKDVKEMMQTVKEKTEKIVDKGKDVYDTGKSIVEKGQKITREAEKMIGEKKQ